MNYIQHYLQIKIAEAAKIIRSLVVESTSFDKDA